tara:strand:- start:743 stop:1207 length:465 start_codon:yes stop_codon:yes gene_type:complete
MCVFGELFYDSFIPGFCCGLIFLIICFFKTSNKKNFILTVLSISTIGYLFDSVLIFLQIYNFETSYYFGFLPLWMLILWPSFATLFDEVFRFFSQYKILAVLLSSILGPLTYFSGEILGIININNIFLFFILMVIFWAALMIFYLSFIVKLKLN